MHVQCSATAEWNGAVSISLCSKLGGGRARFFCFLLSLPNKETSEGAVLTHI